VYVLLSAIHYYVLFVLRTVPVAYKQEGGGPQHAYLLLLGHNHHDG
jgi:hypothetical protein